MADITLHFIILLWYWCGTFFFFIKIFRCVHNVYYFFSLFHLYFHTSFIYLFVYLVAFSVNKCLLHFFPSFSWFRSKMDKIVLSCPPYTKSFTNCQYAVGLMKDGMCFLVYMTYGSGSQSGFHRGSCGEFTEKVWIIWSTEECLKVLNLMTGSEMCVVVAYYYIQGITVLKKVGNYWFEVVLVVFGI